MLEHSLLYPESTATRTAVRLDGMWRFAIDWNGEGDAAGWKDRIPGHDTIPVPASFQDFYTDKAVREFTGDVWYGTDVVVPAAMKGTKVLLRFGAATHRAEIYLNGKAVGSHEGGFLPFVADITKEAVYGAPNRLVVKVNNELTETNIPCGRTITLSDGRKMTKPYFAISDGCIVEGQVENSILFRGVKVGKDSVVRNSIIMQDTVIGDSVQLNCVITDKNVVIRDHRNLSGCEVQPYFLAKGTMI